MSDGKWTDQEQEVWEVIKAFNHAFAENDVERYFTYIDNEITVITPSNPYRIEGLVADRDEFEFSLNRGTTRINFFQELQPYIHVFGDSALVTYYSRGSYGQDATRLVYLKETDILVRKNNTWKIVHIHVSVTV